MPNVFDQFDAGSASGGTPSAPPPTVAAAGTGNVFDRFDDPTTTPGALGNNPMAVRKPASTDRTPTLGEVGSQFGYGLASGIPNAAGGMMDMLEKGTMQGFSNPGTGENLFHQLGRDVGIIRDPAPAPAPYQPVLGTALHKDMQALGPLNPDNLPAPQSGPERIARMGGEGASLAIAPELALARATEAASIPAALGNAFRAGVTGTASGAAAQGASEVTPEPYKPLAALAGGLAGGVGAEVAASGLARAGEGVGNFARPFTQAGREAAIGQKLVNTASDPDATIAALGQPSEIVPGSMPTTFQQSGDMGLGGLERSVATRNPEAFNSRRAEQNAARLDELGDIAADGYPEAVANMVRGLHDSIDQQTQALYDQQAHAAASEASIPNMGGGVSPEGVGADIQSAVNPQIEAQQAAARAGLDDVGGLTPAATRGRQAQNAIQEGIDALTAHKNALYDIVDPDKNMQMVSGPLQNAERKVYGDMGPAKLSTISSTEQRVQQLIQGYGPVIPFQEGRDLSSVISSAMQEARNPLTPNYAAYARLSQLRGAVEDAISDSVQGSVAQEQQAVASGAMAPEQTLGARMLAESRDWIAGNKQAAARADGTLGPADNAGAGSASVSGSYGAEVPAGSGLGSGSRAQGLPQDAGSGPFVGQQTAARLRAANAANKELRTIEGAKPVASIIQRPGSSYPYTMPPEGVAGHLWQAGPKGAASIKAILRAAQSSPDAIESIRESAAADLRSQAPDGILTPQKFGQWRARHADALAALETAAPGTTARFENAAQASHGLERFAGYDPRVSASALPERYFATGEKGFQTVSDLRELIGKDRADNLLSNYAADSLRKSAGNADGTIDPAKLATWRKTHSGALRALPDADAKFQTAGKAAEGLDALAAQRKKSLADFQKSALGDLLKVDNSQDVTRTIGAVFDRRGAVSAMKQIADAARPDPVAFQGLRKAVVDFMQAKLISNTEAGTSGKNLIKSDAFQTFLGKNYTALRQVFSDDELGAWRAIAQDLKRANRSVTAVKLPGQSNTVQDLTAMSKHGSAPTLLHLMGHVLGKAGKIALPLIGYQQEGMLGFAAGLAADQAAGYLGSLHAAGIGKMDELLTEAMLNPELARTLMMKASKHAASGSGLTLKRVLRGIAVAGPTANAALAQESP